LGQGEGEMTQKKRHLLQISRETNKSGLGCHREDGAFKDAERFEEKAYNRSSGQTRESYATRLVAFHDKRIGNSACDERGWAGGLRENERS